MNNDGGCAFPCDSREAREFAGMTLRDWFAGQALSGILGGRTKPLNQSAPESEKVIAESSYIIADAMLVERQKAAP